MLDTRGRLARIRGQAIAVGGLTTLMLVATGAVVCGSAPSDSSARRPEMRVGHLSASRPELRVDHANYSSCCEEPPPIAAGAETRWPVPRSSLIREERTDPFVLCVDLRCSRLGEPAEQCNSQVMLQRAHAGWLEGRLGDVVDWCLACGPDPSSACNTPGDPDFVPSPVYGYNFPPGWERLELVDDRWQRKPASSRMPGRR